MSGSDFVIGAKDGIVVNVDDLLEALEAESNRALSDKERVLAEGYLREVLGASQRLLPPDRGYELRIGEGRYLAVGRPGQLGLAVLGGPLLHIVGAHMALSAAARLLKFDRGRRPQLITLYAQLAGDDRSVFEAIHQAQQQLLVVNYDAQKARQFSQAYGRQAPTPGELVEALSGSMTEARVREVLAKLLSKGILKTDGDRYWIAF